MAPEDTWAEMKDSMEDIKGRSGSRAKVYAAIALVTVGVIVFACFQLSSSSGAAGQQMQALHQPEPVTASETKLQSSQVVRAAHQKLHLKSLMTSPAIHWAQNY